MIAREILAVCQRLNLKHIDLKCLPAEWHHYPEKIAPGVEKAVKDAKKQGFKHIFIAYADCGTGGKLDKVCKELKVERIEGPHCFSFYMGNEQFKIEEEKWMTTFFMTDFLARHFKTFLMKPLGLDKHPELRDAYFGHYDKMLYLAQTQNKNLEEKAKEAAEILGLEYVYQKTGYGDLETHLKQMAQ